MDSANRHLTLLQEYIDTVERLFPTLARSTLDSLSISPADALSMGLFVDYYPRRSVVLERGVLLGTSTYLLASHPKVSRVVGVDPNPHVTETVPVNGRNGSDDAGEPEGPKVLDVARAALAEHGLAWRKTKLHDSAESSTEEVALESLEVTDSTATQVADSSADEGLIVLINNPQRREEVFDELKTILGRHPQALAFLGNCRKSRGPFVQAGIVDFLSEAQGDYHFRLVSDLGLGLATSSLGVVYPDQVGTDMEEVLDEIARQFSERLDPLRLLQRKEDSNLKQRTIQLKKQNDELNKRISSLTQHIEHLNYHYSSRRYKLADATMNRVSRIKSLSRLMR